MYYVYLLASKPHGTLYVGVTSDLARRIFVHKQKLIPGFTERYSVDRLVWFEGHDTVEEAIRREKRIKEWKRDWKINLIESDNPRWIDLYPSLSTNRAV
jgi:putative endonuclease